MKKLISAASALAMAASMVGAAVPFAAGAADASKGYELRAFTNKAGEAVSTKISTDEINAGDVTVPVAVYLDSDSPDAQFFTAQWTVNSKDGDASTSNVSFKGYAPNSAYFDSNQTFTLADGSTVETNKIIGFCGTIKTSKNGANFSDKSPNKVYNFKEGYKTLDIPNAWGSLVWDKPVADATVEYTGAECDSFPMVVFDVTFKKGTPAGTYTVEFIDKNDSTGVPSTYIEAGIPKVLYTPANNNLTLKSLDIVIGDGASSTPATTAAATPATTAPASPATTAPSAPTTTAPAQSGGNDIPVKSPSDFETNPDFIVKGEDYVVKPGEDINVEFKVQKAGGHVATFFLIEFREEYLPAGITSSFDDTYCYAAVPGDKEYTVYNGYSYQANVTGEGSWPVEVTEGEAIIQFTLHIPEDIAPGVYNYGLNACDVTEWATAREDHDISLFAATLIPGTLTVEGDPVATTAPATTPATTAAPAPATTAAPAPATTAAPAPATTAAPAPATTAAPVGNVLYGDTNVDGKVNIADVVVLNKWLNDAKSYDMTTQGKVNADCCDEKGGEGLDKNDSDAIIRSIVHLVTLPCASADLK